MEAPRTWNLVVAIAITITIAAASSVRAQSATAQAETLFREGRKLVADGKLAEGCAAFAASQKLDPAISTVLNEASCREGLGQLATAWGLFLDAERQARPESTEVMRKLHRIALDHATKLEPRLSTLTVRVPEDHRVLGLQILRDGAVIEEGAWNRALPVDGGMYKITARAPGNADWSTTVTVGLEHDVKAIETPKLLAAVPSNEAPKVEPMAAARPPSKRLPFVVGGAAVALLGGALGFELWGSSTYDQAKREVDDAKQHALWSSANTKRYVAEGMAIGGVACAGVAVWLYLRHRAYEREPHETSALTLQPIVGGDVAGFSLQGAY